MSGNPSRAVLLLCLAVLLPACGVSNGGGTLTPTVAPAAPDGVGAKNGNQRVVLTWTASPAASQYLVRRSTAHGGPYADLPASVGLTTTTFADTTGLTNGQTYYYIVNALNFFGRSIDSSEISATPGFAGARIAAGHRHSHALLQDGSVWSWGSNTTLTLGDGTDRPVTTVAVPVDLPGVRALSAGHGHVLALMADGSVRSWGDNLSGELGNNSTTPSSTPVSVLGLSGVVQVVAGHDFSLALLGDGSVQSWGTGPAPGPVLPSVPAPVPGLSNILQIAAGGDFALALKDDGTVWAWGSNSQGRLGTGSLSPSSSTTPLQVINLTGITAIAGGDGHSLALRSDGTVWGWGNNFDSRLGAVTPLPYSPIPVQTSGLTGIIAVAAGSEHSAALRADGKVLSWGNNNFGQTGSGTPGTTVFTPTVIPDLSQIVAISTYAYHTLALSSGGDIWAWGHNDQDQLGSGTGAIQNFPVNVSNLTSVASVSAGGNHSLAARTDGTAWAWGDNTKGQLGNALPATTSNYRIQVSGLPADDVTDVAAGGFYSLFRRSNGTVYACGWNNAGQLGNNNAAVASSSAPLQVVNLPGTTMNTHITAIAAGNSHALAISQSKTVWAWGNNTWGQVGNNSLAASIYAPAQVSGLTNVIGVAAATSHSLAVKGDGTVWAWGDNSNSQLGNTGVVGLSRVPVQVTGMAGAVAVAAGNGFSLAVKDDGTLWAWGTGYLGDGQPGSTTAAPIQVLNVAGAVAGSGGVAHGTALLGSGAVMGWGLNSEGEVGDGSLQRLYSPVAAAGISTAVKISAGGYHGLALLADGSVRAWGYNYSGQIGIGSNVFSTTPILVTH